MIYIQDVGLVNALGRNNADIADQLRAQKSGLQRNHNWLLNNAQTYIGAVSDDWLPLIDEQYSQHQSRNNRLLLAALVQVKERLDDLLDRYSKERVAIIMGTSTSGIYEGEIALKRYIIEHQKSDIYHYQQQRFSDPSQFLQSYLGTRGPAYTISTACSSSARALISGANLIRSGMVDVAIVGGADTLCQMAINGFNSLGAMSMDHCKPFAENRDGINIGEASGIMVLARDKTSLALLGHGASSDAWHISAPDPTGNGAKLAMKRALLRARLSPKEVGYLNLHGTATALNDSAEALAVDALFGAETALSSTKHLTGHTLGAAGITEAGLASLIIKENLPLPMQQFNRDQPLDLTLPELNFVTNNEQYLKEPCILSNSFAFGGNNASIIIGGI